MMLAIDDINDRVKMFKNSYEYNSFIAGGGLSLYYWKARRRLDAMVS